MIKQKLYCLYIASRRKRLQPVAAIFVSDRAALKIWSNLAQRHPLECLWHHSVNAGSILGLVMERVFAFRHIKAWIKWRAFCRRHFKCIWLEETVSFSIPLTAICTHEVHFKHSALARVMDWYWIGDKPLRGSMTTQIADTQRHH